MLVLKYEGNVSFKTKKFNFQLLTVIVIVSIVKIK